MRAGLRMAVGAPPQSDRTEGAARRRAVALLFVGLDAAAADRDRERKAVCEQDAARTLARSPPHHYPAQDRCHLAAENTDFPANTKATEQCQDMPSLDQVLTKSDQV
jgi:hypothetical protein